MSKRRGTIYLVHFDRPLGHPTNRRGQARHYVGWTADLHDRIARHREGNGAAIMAAVTRAGIRWIVAAVWPGTRDDERAFKRQKNAARKCPLCMTVGEPTQARFVAAS